ncbi:cupin domain-containing protein [Haloferax sp. DFSO52]|uniref:cupin domain-containing protein n=1 Tax=Haloferax sp. DFSO52 TaxID=3388505 RepID=UPI003A879E50
MEELTVAARPELDDSDEHADVSRHVLFETEETIMVQSQVAGGVTTGWHHNGDRHVFGHVVQGRATLEYGPAGDESVELAVGDSIYVPPHTIRRVVNPHSENWVIVICFVGTGPPAVSVDGPQTDAP